MGLFDIFKKTSTVEAAKNPNQAVAQYVQRRHHKRYDINAPELCVLSIADAPHVKLTVRNISHMGCFGVPAVPGDKRFEQLSIPFRAILTLVGREHSVEVSKIDKRGDGLGVSFQHMSIEALQSMGDLIAPLRWGETAVHLGDEALPNGKRTKFRGEGSFDLAVETGPSDEITFVMGSFRNSSGDYVCATWDGSSLTTKRSASPGDPSARMLQTDKVDVAAVGMLVVGCLGMKSPLASRCAIFLYRCVTQVR